MLSVEQTREFSRWLRDLRDKIGRARIQARIDRLGAGAAGDVKAVGDDVVEMRIDFGPGYRVYYTRMGAMVILLLCGGDKSSQQRDIDKAKRMARELRADPL